MLIIVDELNNAANIGLNCMMGRSFFLKREAYRNKDKEKVIPFQDN